MGVMRRMLPVIMWTLFLANIMAQPPGWTYNAADYAFNGEITGSLVLDGLDMTTGTIGAFVGDECRGFAEATFFPPTESYVYTLIVYSNEAAGETLSFKYYYPAEEREYDIRETREFVSDMIVGTAVEPFSFSISTNEPPEVIRPIPDQELDEYFTSRNFDLDTIFSDPDDGQQLAYSADSDDESVVTAVINGNTLIINEKGLGFAEIVVTADDGRDQVSDRFLVTVNNVNDAPVIGRRLEDITRVEGFGSVKIDLDGTFSDPDNDPLDYTFESTVQSVADIFLESDTLVIMESGTGITEILVEATDGAFSASQLFTFTVIEENILTAFYMDQEIASGDTIFRCYDADNFIVEVSSQIEWNYQDNSSWIALDAPDLSTLSVGYAENLTEEDRYGEITISDEQGNEIIFFLNQTTDCNATLIRKSEADPYRIYPNPVFDRLIIEKLDQESSEYTITIFDSHGRIAINRKYHRSSGVDPFVVDMSRQPPGIYLLHIKKETSVTTTRIIKGAPKR